jgi:hypothetical protein
MNIGKHARQPIAALITTDNWSHIFFLSKKEVSLVSQPQCSVPQRISGGPEPQPGSVNDGSHTASQYPTLWERVVHACEASGRVQREVRRNGKQLLTLFPKSFASFASFGV